jgi:hypothetical protein
MSSQQRADVLRSTSNMKKHGLSVSSEKYSQKTLIGNNTISEIENDSDSDDGNFSECSDTETCKVHSPFSSSSSSSDKENVIHPEPERQEEHTQGPS